MVETLESRRRRKGDEKPLDHNEATQLTRTKTNEMNDLAARQGQECQPQAEMAARERVPETLQIQAKV